MMMALSTAALIAGFGQEVAPLRIDGQKSVPAHGMVKLEVSAAPKDAAIRWRVSPSTGVVRADTAPHLLQFAAPPGEYRVDLIVAAVRDGVILFNDAESVVTIGAVAPPVSPPVAPPVKPDPAKPDPARSVCRIQFGSAGCTAAPIGPKRGDGRWDVLTAAHCLSKVGDTGTLFAQDGRRIPVRVTVIDREADIAWIETIDEVDSLPFANLFRGTPVVGDEVWHAGYGLTRPGVRKNGSLTGWADGGVKRSYTLLVDSGDSGGPIFLDRTGEVLGPVCCTTGRGVIATVFAGNSTRAAAIRPKAKNSASSDEWTPMEIPVRAK